MERRIRHGSVLPALAVFVLLVSGALGVAMVSRAAAEGIGEQEIAVRQYLAELEEYGRRRGYNNISPVDGQLLEMLVRLSGAKKALEIGTANGYSAIWIALGLKATGGHLTTVETNPTLADEARENLRQVGLDGVVTVVTGDAFEVVPGMTDTFSFIFMDDGKSDPGRCFRILLDRLEVGGLLVAHNAIRFRNLMAGFLDAAESHPDLHTVIVGTDRGDGVSLSCRLR